MDKKGRAGSFVQAVLPRVLRGLGVGVVACAPTFVIAALVAYRWDALIHVDQNAVQAATDVTRAHPAVKSALIAWQTAFHPKMVYLAAVPVACLVWAKGYRARTCWGVITMLVGWNLGLQAKLLVERARPVIADPVSHAPGYSFPSGHAFNTTLMLTTCIVMVWPIARRSTIRTALVLGAALLVLLTALDRVFLGVHYPSDVCAGILLGAALALASYSGFAHVPQQRNPAS